jgi:hypothetical protein
VIDHTPPAIVRPAPESPNEVLKQLAKEAKLCLAKARLGLHDSLDWHRQVGIRLLKAKRLAGHKFWLAWLHHNWPYSARKAQQCMKIAREWDIAKAHTAALLDATTVMLCEEHPPETEPAPRQLGDEPEEIDERPTPKVCLACIARGRSQDCKRCFKLNNPGVPGGGDKPLRPHWPTWAKAADRVGKTLDAIAAVHSRARDTAAFEKAERARQDLAEAVAALREQFTGTKVYLHRESA